MTVDVEEAYHAAALASVAPRDRWGQMESRVSGATSRILDLFDETSVKATFFVLGTVAARHPDLVRRIVFDGHELASHGWSHYRVTDQTPEEFKTDVARAKALLEEVGKTQIRGYRAPNFSINHTTWWAYDILAETGHSYSSSINPVLHDHYGQPDAPRTPFSTRSGVIEIPMTTVTLGARRFPVSGGGWFRLLPCAVSYRGLNRAAKSGLRPIFYFHPWEIDPGQPRLKPPFKSRFRHYVNLGRMERKIGTLADYATWDRMDRVYADALAVRPKAWCPGNPPKSGCVEN